MAESVAKQAAAAAASRQPVLIDLGKKKKKVVKSLRRGRGPLMRAVDKALTKLRSSGAVEGNAQDVVLIVVREKPKKSSGGLGW